MIQGKYLNNTTIFLLRVYSSLRACLL